MITYFIPHICYKCLCRVCGQRGCPHRFRQEKRCVSCWRSHEYRPILDCTNFYFMHFHKYKVRRVHKAPKIRYIEKFSDGDVAQLLGEILRLLNSPIAPTEDINCIKSECLCLDCPAASICESRCKRCVDWRGQYPVKMCAVRVQFGKLKGG